MKLFALILSMLLLGCKSSEPQLKWQGRCFPKQFVSDASYITSNHGDTAFDSVVSDAPILLIPANYLVQHIPKFQAFEYRENNSQLHHILSVNFEPKRELGQDQDPSRFEVFSDATDLFITKNREKYSFTLYTKKDNIFFYWGSCVHGSVESYDCFRTIPFNDMNIRYTVNKDNIALHNDLDNFIFNHLNQWQCE